MSTEVLQILANALTQAVNSVVEDKLRAVEKRVEKLELAHTVQEDGTVIHTEEDFGLAERVAALEEFKDEHEAIDHGPLENLEDDIYDKVRNILRNDVTISIDL